MPSTLLGRAVIATGLAFAGFTLYVLIGPDNLYTPGYGTGH